MAELILDPDDAPKRNVVYTIEFSSDFSILVYHAYNKSVAKSLAELAKLVKAGRLFHQDTLEAFRTSETLTINVESAEDLTLEELITKKFEIINKYDTIHPKGHNLWSIELYGLDFPKRLAIKCLGRAHCPGGVIKSESPRKGRPKKAIYQYALTRDIHTGQVLWVLQTRWPSLTDLKKMHKGWSPGNISAACADPTKTAYGFKWSHEPDAIF